MTKLKRDFRVGDTVRVTERNEDYGKITTIVRLRISYNYDIVIDSKKGNMCFEIFSSNDLEHYIVRDTKLARKMYPNFEVFEEGWIIPNGDSNV